MAKPQPKFPSPASATKKPDRDMGREVKSLGGYRPNRQLTPDRPIIRERIIEILIVRNAPVQPRKRVELLDDPILTFRRDV